MLLDTLLWGCDPEGVHASMRSLGRREHAVNADCGMLVPRRGLRQEDD